VDDAARRPAQSYEPFGFEALRAGNRMAFGTATLPTYDFANAKYLLSFGADFLDTWLSPVEFQNDFPARTPSIRDGPRPWPSSCTWGLVSH